MKSPPLPHDPAEPASRGIHPVMGYGLAALIGAAFWASLLFAVF
ncbi:hypothetical protein [Brevundimonas sp. G8]|nr:hypothetical protein [Brevundimonas sp. G8]